MRLQGQYSDDEIEEVYNRFRYYDGQARFTSRDPLGLAGGTAAFAFGPDAFNWIDPLALNRRKRRQKKLKQIKQSAARDGAPNRGCRPHMTRAEANRIGKEWVGDGHKRIIGRNGNVILISADGRRRYRSADRNNPAFDELGQPYSRTNVQANFETGRNLDRRDGTVDANVHVDIVD